MNKKKSGSKENSRSTSSTDLYKRRWVYLIALCIMQLLMGFASSSFGPTKDFYAIIFGKNYFTVFWMAIVFALASVLVTFPITWMTFKQLIRFRSLTLIAVGLLSLGYLFITVSIFVGNYYAIIEVGKVLTDIASQVGMATPAVFAVLWFPENQVGTAIGVNLMGRYLGYLLGNVLPVYLLSHLSDNATNSSELTQLNVADDRFTFLQIFGIMMSISAALHIFLFACLTDEPPRPPTYAQVLKRRANRNKEELTWRKFFKTGKSLLTNKTFILTCFVFGLTFITPTIDFAVTSKVITSWTTLEVPPYVMGGDVIGLYVLGCVLGSICAGKLVDRIKQYHLLAIAGSSVTFIASVWIVVGFLCGNFVLYCLSDVLFGIIGQLTIVTLYEISMQQTYPTNQVFVGCWLIGIQAPISHLVSTLARLVFNTLGGAGVLIFQSAVVFIGFTFSCFFSQTNKRLDVVSETESDAERGEDKKPSELSGLIGDKE